MAYVDHQDHPRVEIQENEYMSYYPSQFIDDKKYSCISMFLLMALFAISYTQYPLYTSNQNTYFLHGLANGGLGMLSDDWMANTTDPVPIFTLLVNLTYTYTSTFLFYIYYGLILGVFIYSILGIASKTWRIDRSYREYLTCFTLVTGLCSFAFSYLSSRIIGMDLRNIFQSGVADQTILGMIFQPSVFGVFLLLSIYVFLCNKPFLSILCLGVAANVHATYLLSASFLTVSYMILIILEEKNFRKSFLLGIWSLVVVSPIICYSSLSFAPTSPEIANQGQHILVDYRIPHHAKVSDWFGKKTLPHLVIIICALWVHRKKRIGLIIFIPFFASLSLTLIQMLTGNKLLALLFPWRASVFLVPLSAFVLTSMAISFIFKRYKPVIGKRKKILDLSLAATLVLLFLSGIFASYTKYKGYHKENFMAMMSFVRDTKAKDDVYLIPVDHPYSVPTKIEWTRFRLQTAVPILVDYKTHPYKDSEVLEWRNRIEIADTFFTGNTGARYDVLREISSRYGVTHVVDNDPRLLDCKGLYKIYGDGKYFVYRIEDKK